ncbi:hypothetical protein M758_2G055900 [Ceratodon purpureus]|nr:hypothetical protein M758_2G055900 [Ceratodon purpureus]
MLLLWYNGWLSVVCDTNGAVSNMISKCRCYTPGSDAFVYLHHQLHSLLQGDSN